MIIAVCIQRLSLIAVTNISGLCSVAVSIQRFDNQRLPLVAVCETAVSVTAVCVQAVSSQRFV